ncbi:MAG: DUF7673 family protein [Bryobacteraceae bacterium]
MDTLDRDIENFDLRRNLNHMDTQETAPLEALTRLCAAARRDTGQSRRVADFLLAWHNTPENGGWDPTDLWNVDAPIAADILTIVAAIRAQPGKYPADVGFEPEIQQIWWLWRASQGS